MFARKFVFTFALLVSLSGAAYSQALFDTTVIPLTVDKDFPLQVTLTETLHLKQNESVRARIGEPVYSFDREVIPAGTEVEGRITGFKQVGKWNRISGMLGGDFTPIREPLITFHTLVFRDGTRMPIETLVVPGSKRTVGLRSDGSDKALKSALTSTVKQSAGNPVKKLLWGMSPYHPSSLAAGTNLDAVLLQPLDFGEAVFQKGALDAVGSQAPADTVVSARLSHCPEFKHCPTWNSHRSATDPPDLHIGSPLIFPAGSTLHGKVTDVNHARSFHRNGQLAFSFTTLEVPAMTASGTPAQAIEGSLFSAAVNHDMKNLRINETARKSSNPRRGSSVRPGLSSKRTAHSGLTSHSFEAALLGGYRNKFLNQLVGRESTFGLPGSITGAMVPPVAIGLGVFGAARSVYSNFIARGRNIVLPANTPMQIRLTTAAPREQSTTSLEDVDLP